MAQNLHRQLDGPFVTALISAGNVELDANDSALTYWQGLTIDSADDVTLYNIGLLVGYRWPSAPVGSFGTQNFEFSNDPTGASPPPIDTAQGLGDTGNPTIGGIFQDATPGAGNYIPAAMYRSLLKGIAQIKYNGFSMARIVSLASVFSNSFTISYSAAYDVNLVYSADIGSGPIWILQEAFNAVTTAPRVNVSYVP